MSDTVLFAGSWLLTFLLHSTVWLGGAWLLLRWLSTASPATREWIWKGATLGALLSPTLQLTAPQWFQIEGLGARFALAGGSAREEPTPMEKKGGVSSDTVVEVELEATPLKLAVAKVAADPVGGKMIFLAQPTTLATAGGGFLSMDPGSWPEGTAQPDPAAIQLSADVPLSATPSLPLWLQMMIGLWVVGAVIGVSLWGWRLYALKRQLSNRMQLTSGALVRNVQGDLARYGRGKVRLSVSDRIHVPIAFGCLRGEVCLPMRALNDLDATHQRSMVGHELAHLRRRDPLWITFYNLIQRVLFVQPLLLVARREAMHAAEELCDSWACRGTGNRFAMAECLTEVANWLRPEKRDLPVACMAQAASPLQRRVERLLDSKTATLDQTRAGRAALILLILLLGMAFVAPGAASHFTTTNPSWTASVDLLKADLDLAQARIRFLKIEVAAMERDLLFADPSVGETGELRHTLNRLRRQLSLLEQNTLEISRELPATNES